MSEIHNIQTCPYCGYEEPENTSIWEEGVEEDVKCSHCDKNYIVKPQYTFIGWKIEKECENCDTATEDGMWLCDCHNTHDKGDDIHDSL